MFIKNDLTNGKSVSIQDYVDLLDNAETIKLGKGECNKSMEGVVKSLMQSVTDLGVGKREEIPEDFDELLGRLGNMNRILNDTVVIILRPELDKRDRVGDLLAKYRDENGKKIFTDCERFNNRKYDDVRSFLRGIIGVHDSINSTIKKNSQTPKRIVSGGSVLNARRHQFVIDFREIDDYVSNMVGGKGCSCQEPRESVKLPSTGPINDRDRRIVHKLLDFIRLYFPPNEIKKCTCGANKDEEKGENEGEDDKEQEDKNEKEQGDKNNKEGGSKENNNNSETKDTGKTDGDTTEEPKKLSDFLNQGDKLDDLVYSERDKSEEDKTHFSWLHWKFYRLWTMEKIHPILTLPFNMVEPILKSFGIIVKRFLSPILLKISTPLLSAAWQGVGALISVSSMVPFVGIVTGVLSTVHNVATIPVNILLREGASILQAIIDSMVDAVSVIFNLQRGKWGLALESLLKVIKSNGLFNNLMGQLRNLTIIAKKFNKILDEIKDYPNLADEILEEMDKVPFIKEFFDNLDEDKLKDLEGEMQRFLKIGTKVSKYFLDKTNGLVFLLGLPGSLIEEDDFYKSDKNKKGGGLTIQKRENLVREFFKVATTPINVNNRVLIREKLQLLDDLHEQINA